MLVRTVGVCVPSCLLSGVEMGLGPRVRWGLAGVRQGQEKRPGLGTPASMMAAVLAYPLLTLVEGFRSFYVGVPPSVVQDWISGPNLTWGFLLD